MVRGFATEQEMLQNKAPPTSQPLKELVVRHLSALCLLIWNLQFWLQSYKTKHNQIPPSQPILNKHKSFWRSNLKIILKIIIQERGCSLRPLPPGLEKGEASWSCSVRGPHPDGLPTWSFPRTKAWWGWARASFWNVKVTCRSRDHE